MRYPRAPLWCGDGGGEVLVKKGRRKVGEGERSSRVGLLLGLCLGLMAWSMRPFPSFSMCFCGRPDGSGQEVTWHRSDASSQNETQKSSPELPQDQTSARSSQWTPWISPPISGWGRCSSPPPSAQTLYSSPPRLGLSSSPCPRAPADGTSSPRAEERVL